MILNLLIIVEPPSFPSNARITSIHNGNYSATVELAWDFSHLNNDTFFTISISSNGGGTWFSRAIMEDQNASITLSYNTDYTLDVVASNCAGHSEDSSTLGIFLGIASISRNYMHD
jgi:archaellin